VVFLLQYRLILPKFWKMSPKFRTYKIGRKKHSDALGNEKKMSVKKNRIRRNVCVSPSVKSTNFAKTLENVAQISDIQNWEEKKT
jgi:hypothetical protein